MISEVQRRRCPDQRRSAYALDRRESLEQMIQEEMEALRAMLAGALQPRPSSRRTPFTFLDNGFASSPALAALCAHSAFSFCAHAETNTPDYDPDPRGGAFLDDPASFRARFLNDVVVREGGCNRQNCQSGTGQNCSHGSLR
jgi:hypothetical protein